jgi:integrase
MATRDLTLEQRLLKDRLPEIDDGERVIWDHRMTGLGLRLRARSSPVWIGQRRIDGRTVKRTLGMLDGMDIDEARAVARATFDHDGQRLRVAPTLASFVPIFIEDNAGRWKPNTVRSHRRDLLRHVVPVLGAMPVDAMTRADVLAWQDGLDLAPGSHNRILAVLSGLMLHAESLGFRAEGSNPCAGLRRRQTGFKARYLDDHDFARLAAALDQAEVARPIEVAAIRFLMLTGARQSEMLMLEWTMIHGSRAALPDSKTGPKTIWLCAPVRRLLAALAEISASPRVFAMPHGQTICSSLRRCWHEVRALSGLDGVRLHDLRHSYASVAVSTGEDLKTVAGLLGHAELETTKGYAHLAFAPIQAAAGRVSGHLAVALTPATPIEPFPSRPCKIAKPRRRKKPKAIDSRTDPKPNAKPPRIAKPKAEKATTSPAAKAASAWRAHILAFRRSDLRLDAFCAAHGLDPTAFSRAMRVHYRKRRAKAGTPS